MRWLLPTLLFVGVVGCNDRSSPGGKATPADVAPLAPALEGEPAPSGPSTVAPSAPVGFDWGPPCRVPAVQEIDDDGRRARLAFDVVLERGANGFVARLENMRAVATPATANMAPTLDLVLRSVDGAIPPIEIADNGEARGAIDVDRAIDAVLKLVPRDRNRERFEKVLRSPQWRAAFAQKAGETWSAWVGAFVGMDIAPHTIRRDKVDLETGVGTFKDVAVTVTHHGAVRSAPSLALISVEQTIEGPELGNFIVGMLKDVMPPSAGSAPSFEGARKTDTITVAIDPRLGRPHRSRHVMKIELEGRHKQRTRDTAFNWSAATGCVAGDSRP